MNNNTFSSVKKNNYDNGSKKLSKTLTTIETPKTSFESDNNFNLIKKLYK